MPLISILSKKDKDMSKNNFGNTINRIICYSKKQIFQQGELAQLSFNALLHYADELKKQDENQEIEIDVPIGYYPTRTPMLSKKKYTVRYLLDNYDYLSRTQLAVNGIYQIVTIIECLLNDLLFEVILKCPEKIDKKQIEVKRILKANSFEELKRDIIYSVVNELSYRSPQEYAREFEKYAFINLLECPAYQRYIEVKATRDVLIHNKGIANRIYVSKSGMFARVNSGVEMPVDDIYFMESYEYSLKLTEWLEKACHERWFSEEFEEKNKEIQSVSQQNTDSSAQEQELIPKEGMTNAPDQDCLGN